MSTSCPHTTVLFSQRQKLLRFAFRLVSRRVVSSARSTALRRPVLMTNTDHPQGFKWFIQASCLACCADSLARTPPMFYMSACLQSPKSCLEPTTAAWALAQRCSPSGPTSASAVSSALA